MSRVINRYKNNSCLRIFRSVARRDYLELMKIASAMVGNSSSGIIEAPTFSIRQSTLGRGKKGESEAATLLMKVIRERKCEGNKTSIKQQGNQTNDKEMQQPLR